MGLEDFGDFGVMFFPIAWASGRPRKLSARCATVEEEEEEEEEEEDLFVFNDTRLIKSIFHALHDAINITSGRLLHCLHFDVFILAGVV
jgi:hypothetical protein